MKRVLFIASKPFFPWRSSCIRAGHDLLALTQLGYEVDFLTVPIGTHHPIPGVRILRVPNLLLARNLPEGPSLRKLAFDLLLLARGAWLALRGDYAVVHGMDDAGLVAWACGRLGGAAVIFERHADTSHTTTGAWRRCLLRLYQRAERFVLRRADAAIGAGAELVPAMQALGRGSRVCRIPDIPSALDVPPDEHVAECRARLTRHVDDLLVTYVGSFANFQGLDLLFHAMPRVCQADERVHFVVVGGTPGEIGRQERLLARKGLVHAVTFLGRVTPVDLAAVLAASDILVAPRLEGAIAPMKVLDYLQSGTAIVATDSPANRDVLTPEVAMLTPARPDAFADGILALCRDPAQRHEFGRRGRELIAQTLRFEQFRDHLRQCYDYVTTVGQEE
jgi:glycosyltransferase involved in cell wall biosynthesis